MRKLTLGHSRAPDSPSGFSFVLQLSIVAPSASASSVSMRSTNVIQQDSKGNKVLINHTTTTTSTSTTARKVIITRKPVQVPPPVDLVPLSADGTGGGAVSLQPSSTTSTVSDEQDQEEPLLPKLGAASSSASSSPTLISGGDSNNNNVPSRGTDCAGNKDFDGSGLNVVGNATVSSTTNNSPTFPQQQQQLQSTTTTTTFMADFASISSHPAPPQPQPQPHLQLLQQHLQQPLPSSFHPSGRTEAFSLLFQSRLFSFDSRANKDIGMFTGHKVPPCLVIGVFLLQ